MQLPSPQQQEYIKYIRIELEPFELSGKVACFIPSWMTTVLDNSVNQETFYKASEQSFYKLILQIFLQNKSEDGMYSLRYRVIRYNFPKNHKKDPTLKLLKDIKKETEEVYSRSNKDVLAIRSCQDKLEDFLSDAEFVIRPFCMPISDDDKKYIIDQEWIDLLLIDYDQLNKSVLYCIAQELDYKFNRKGTSLNNNKSFTDDLIALSMTRDFEKVALKFFQMKDMPDKIALERFDSFESEIIKMKTQKIPAELWKTVNSTGGILSHVNNTCINNTPPSKNNSKDITLFLSLEGLLSWEILTVIKSRKRCKECNNILPTQNKQSGKYRGKYCPEWVAGYSSCHKARNKNRQKKYYQTNKS